VISVPVARFVSSATEYLGDLLQYGFKHGYAGSLHQYLVGVEGFRGAS
jgi:hypothetical protein